MKNFEYQNSVKIIFGKGEIEKIKQEIPAGSRVLMTYGGGSIKNNGVYDQVYGASGDFSLLEFSGIEPNPRYETLMKAVEIVRKEKIDFLLSVGGGSVLDGTKFIAAASLYENGDPWRICSHQAPVERAVPLGAILTLPATGSEMNGTSVISRESTNEKMAFRSPLVFPKFSVLDPEVTYSLPERQIANGIVDSFIHVTEQYLTYPVNSPVQDRFCEGLLNTIIHEGTYAIKNKTPDYDNRANLMWAATMALNGLLSCGVETDWATHLLGHELTALHGLDHAVTLAILWPGVMGKTSALRKDKLLLFAKNVWNIDIGTDEVKIDSAIRKTEEFFRSLGVKTRLSEHDIGEQTIDKIMDRLEKRGLKTIGMQTDIPVEHVRSIFLDRL